VRGTWQGPAPIGAPRVFPPGAAVAASSQFGWSDQTDVFVVDGNGTLNVAWVRGDGGWQGPLPIPAITLRAVRDGGLFIEVTGIRFTRNQTVTLGYDITSGGGPTTHQNREITVTSDGTGSFLHRIQVNLARISAAQAQATDPASGMAATALIEN
jgi:hypothetical protein